MVSGGGVVEKKIVFGVDQLPPASVADPSVPIRGFHSDRPFAHVNLEFIFNLDEIRRDRLHLLELDLYYSLGLCSDGTFATAVSGRLNKAF
jgi:hypothetical protein